MAELTPDDEDEQLRLAIALSLQDASPSAAAATVRDPVAAPPNAPLDGRTNQILPQEHAMLRDGHNPHEQPPSSCLGLDRRAMEAARLARLARAHTSEVPGLVGTKRDRHHSQSPESQTSDNSKRRRSNLPPNTTRDADPRGLATSTVPQIAVPYPRGVVKKTWCFGFERSREDIKLEEILQKSTLKLAVLSSFIWDIEWALSKLDETTKVIFVMQAKDDKTKEQYQSEAKQLKNRSIRLCFPPMPGNVNCMHSKLMLLAHADYLRIVVPTANLVPFDWGETGKMENTVFIVDLPRFQEEQFSDPHDSTFFAQELWHFCEAMGLGPDTVQSLGRFDFSATKDLALIHSIGGEEHSEANWRRTGYPGLGRAVDRLGLKTDGPLRLDFVASSIGALNRDFLRMIYLACQGDDGLTELRRRTQPKPKKETNAATSSTAQRAIDSLFDNFNIYFPSEETVRQSRGGYAHAGTVCFQERWYDSPQFEKRILRDCRSVRPGLLMHNKLLYVQEEPLQRTDQSEPASDTKAWVYIGSANCSESAWGRLVRDRTSKQTKLTCRNWECGVLLRVPRRRDPTADRAIDQQGPNHLDIFRDTLPAPIQLPAKILHDSGLRPWFFSAHH